MPNTHRRRDSTRQLRRVGVGTDSVFQVQVEEDGSMDGYQWFVADVSCNAIDKA